MNKPLPLFFRPKVKADVDWIKAARLRKLADGGDHGADDELKRMEETEVRRKD
jgi:hypothetical protein